MAECDLKFSGSSSSDAGVYKFLELPPELCKLIEASVDDSLSLTIKGQPGEDAVLCTTDKTYSLRSVVLSNSVLVVTPDANETGDLVVRDQLNEILELVPSVPKLHKLNSLLKGLEYDEGQADVLTEADDEDTERQPKRRKFTYDDARAEIQASDVELARSMCEKRILVLDGQLRPIGRAYLDTILELLLNYLVSLSLPHKSAPVEELASTMADEHEVSREVSTQVMSWFGRVDQGAWDMDVNAVLKEIGLGILRNHKNDPILEDEFIRRWKRAVGDTFEASVSLGLLSGNYLSTLQAASGPSVLALTYFPSSALPVDPAGRFADLFITRSRWKNEEIAPFLADIAVDSKERDKLLLKYARATTDPSGVWYTARAKYNG